MAKRFLAWIIGVPFCLLIAFMVREAIGILILFGIGYLIYNAGAVVGAAARGRRRRWPAGLPTSFAKAGVPVAVTEDSTTLAQARRAREVARSCRRRQRLPDGLRAARRSAVCRNAWPSCLRQSCGRCSKVHPGRSHFRMHGLFRRMH